MSHDDKRFDPQRQHRLLSAERHTYWNPPQFLSRFDLHPGQTVLDLGAGPGFWTLPLAEMVGATGQVWAVDVSQ
jgi:ubiquinone/menaquinone biosynthesis C-methylase UbiE